MIYDLSRPSGSRVESVRVRCASCDVPRYDDLDVNQSYNVVINTFLSGGGDGHSTFLVSLTFCDVK